MGHSLQHRDGWSAALFAAQVLAFLVVASCSFGTEVVEEGAQADALLIIGGSNPFLGCSGPRPTCPCARARAECIGSGWACVSLVKEECNGVDDDCDGQVDEGDLCDDGFDCSIDSCGIVVSISGDKIECRHDNMNARCDDGASCTRDVCNAGGARHDGTGCLHIPNDAACDDGCDCSGKEQCAPQRPGADAATGCGATEACDGSNACELTACCELNGMSEACRRSLLARGASPGDLDALNATCKLLPGHNVVSTTGNAVRCLDRPIPRLCSDGNPCTRDECDPRLGCRFPAVADCTVASSGQDGCDLQVCMGGIPQRRLLSYGQTQACDPPDRAGEPPRPPQPLPTPNCGRPGRDPYAGTCMASVCQGGVCQQKPSDCDDGLFCNGWETCYPFPGPHDAVAGKEAGCIHTNSLFEPDLETCFDNNTCTVGTCNEATRSCRFDYRACSTGGECDSLEFPCPTAQTCDRGYCVGPEGRCSHPKFRCPTGTSCHSGVCVDDG